MGRGHRRFWLPALMVAAAAAAGMLAGCGPQVETTVTDNGGAYTIAEVQRAASSMNLGDVARLKTDDAPEARNKALVRLRTHGKLGAAVADLLTREFGSKTRSVPVSVESAAVDGVDAWIVIEAAPGATGRLTTRRLWVFDRSDGSVIQSASYR